MDDTHTTVVVSCAKALTAFLSCSANDAIFELREVFFELLRGQKKGRLSNVEPCKDGG